MTYHDPHAAEEALGAAMMALAVKEGQRPRLPSLGRIGPRPGTALLIDRVDLFMSDGEWHCYSEIAEALEATRNTIARIFADLSTTGDYERRLLPPKKPGHGHGVAEWRRIDVGDQP